MTDVRKLALRRETLVDLTADDLGEVAGGDSSYTGRPGCVLSFDPPCVSGFCTGPFDCWLTS